MRSFLATRLGAVATAVLVAPLLLAHPAAARAAGPPNDGTTAAEARRTGGVQSLPLQPLDAGPRAGGEPAEPAEPAGTQGLPSTDTGPFSLLGVVWTDPAAELHGQVQVTTRAAGTDEWSEWVELDAQDAHAPDPGTAEAGRSEARGGTVPLWVGPSDGVRVRVVPDEGPPAPGLPEGLSLELVDPGEENGTGETAPAVATEPRAGVTAGEHEGPRPPIVIRSGWGADESLRESGFVYTDTIRTAFVHHTAGTNAYECEEAPALLRGIYRYHVESQGWRDVGYNFFVDKCGTIYEGRAGGVAEPVQGAHTYGFNHNSTGVAVLGTYTSTDPGRDVRDALSLLTAWKLGLHGRDPAASSNRTSGGGKWPAGTTVKLNNISGHRDGYATACPGDELYADLPTVRSTAAKLQGR
ncbi:N-acetylmuramoyl-L-alanine amidase [Streptomyces litchfieldiae]|uniref:N-acetylmuramoyl-L-alanine amidase n=1 Tax=Streptomyces litchfieldiae TaxID=3075543 RepID=A0ABU2MZ64_9ACTN|nr:N-acetylmuramoyl-L-alanine amidase [Streptomyces sp. DSM 44938]MDT0346801.1 N-acetylmuramoyl-L-alanine amidase [Streptomyces sp. DSM 44938]